MPRTECTSKLPQTILTTQMYGASGNTVRRSMLTDWDDNNKPNEGCCTQKWQGKGALLQITLTGEKYAAADNTDNTNVRCFRQYWQDKNVRCFKTILTMQIYTTSDNTDRTNVHCFRQYWQDKRTLLQAILTRQYCTLLQTILTTQMYVTSDSSKLVICVVLLLLVLFYVLFVFVLFYVLFACKRVLYQCYRVLTQ